MTDVLSDFSSLDEAPAPLSGELATALTYAVNVLRQSKQFPEVLEPTLSFIQVTLAAELSPTTHEDIRTIVEGIGNTVERRSKGRRRRRCAVPVRRLRPSQLLNDVIATLSGMAVCEGEWRRRRIRDNIAFLASGLDLTSVDCDLLELLALCHYMPTVDGLVDDLTDALHSASAAISCVLEIEPDRAHRLIMSDSPLIRSGLLHLDTSERSFRDMVSLFPRLSRIMTRPYDTEEGLRNDILGAAISSRLSEDDFPHLQDDRHLLARLLRGAAAQKAEGINILIYGPPGTGKTEFARVLARSAGVNLYSAGEADSEGEEPTRNERLSELLFKQRLLAGHQPAAIMFDEMDDLFAFNPYGLSRGSGSKVFLNRLLETNPVPAIWIVNDLDRVPSPLVRRMSYALHIGLPPASVRENIWWHLCDDHGLAVDQETIAGLARMGHAPPAVAAKTAYATALSGGNEADLKRALSSVMQALDSGRPLSGQSREDMAGLDPRMASADTDLDVLASRLADSGARRFSVCLSGPPGTGKSAFARYLADRLGLEVSQKRASDLLGPYVGQSEARIAEAFKEAEARNTFLIFDEADSLLANRQGAHRSHEVSQVNEMLSWMEKHPLPFACTTNLMERMDAACLRRFTFKIGFGYLSADAAAHCFRRFFGTEPPEDLTRLNGLTPGDFVVVRRKADVLDTLRDPVACLHMLQSEVIAKGLKTNAIGFIQ